MCAAAAKNVFARERSKQDVTVKRRREEEGLEEEEEAQF